MELLLTISVTVIAIVMVLAMIFLIAAFLQVRRTGREVERFFEAARGEIAPISHDVTITVQEVNGIIKSIRGHVDGMGEGISTFRHTAVRLRELEDTLSKIEEPLLTLSTLVSAVGRVVGASIRAFRS
jgi:uncharacterized protein YoxC